MKNVMRLMLTILGAITIIILGLLLLLSFRPAPPFFVAHVNHSNGVRIVTVARTDGRGSQAVSAASRDSWSPTWSPDGAYIAYLSHGDHLNTRLKLATLDDNLSTVILTSRRYLLSPAWSPDSREIAFSEFRDGSHSIARINITSRTIHHITDNLGNDLYPAWSPNGEWIAFVSDRDHDEVHSNDIYRIGIGDSSSKHLEQLTFDPEHAKRMLVWSPDGSAIAFIARTRNGPSVLNIIDVSTGNIREIADVADSDVDWRLSWPGNGQWLYYLGRIGSESVWMRIRPDGEDIAQVSNNIESFQDANWLPANERQGTNGLIAPIVVVFVGTILFLASTGRLGLMIVGKRPNNNQKPDTLVYADVR